MANKFLGLDSVNVLKDYIDKQILVNNENTRVVTVHAYKYVEDGIIPETPNHGSFDPEGANITYPGGWSSLKVILNNIGDNAAIEDALAKGSIWMTVGVFEGANRTTNTWSTPIKVSGQNGVSVRFAYAYSKDTPEDQRSKYPQGVNSNNRFEYVWSKYGDDAWVGPNLWATYTVDATNVVWRYCLSNEIEEGLPVNPTPWSLDLPLQAITEEYPYMWMSYKIIPARPIDEIEDEPNSTTGWTTPVLFGHYGKDGIDGKDGVDGNVPDYNLVIYSTGNGFYAPEKPIIGESNLLEDFRADNPTWVDLPTRTEKVTEPDINAMPVSTEEELINNLTSGASIVLTENIDLTNAIVVTTDVTIDINGKKITGGLFAESNGEMLEGTTDSYVFWVKDGGNLIINDSVGTGEVIAQDAVYSMAVWMNGGTVTINGGNYYNGGDSCDLIYASNNGTVTINGGYFKASGPASGTVPGTKNPYSALNIKDRDTATCSIIVNGGSFYMFNPANNLSESQSWIDAHPNGFVSPNCMTSMVDDNFVVTVDPTTIDPEIWWHCSVKVNGQTSEIIDIGDVYRYNAVDGNAKPGQFTKYLFYWSTEQTIPEDITDNDWVETPTYDANDQEGSLWMKVTDVKIDSNTGKLALLKPWSDPIKLTGPRGPIAYDYRIETRYNVGTEAKPKALPTEVEWSKNAPNVTSQYPYIWAVNYLLLYKMKYDTNGDIVTADNGKLLETYNHFRLSGINGEDGNRKNSLKYSNKTETISVTSFSENNLYVANSTTDVIYNMNLDQLSFINGYTGKFANIGTGKMTINGGKYKFIGSCTEATIIELNPQEQIELVCYNNGENKELLVIGKSL